MSPLQKGISHRAEAKIAKILKKKFKNLKIFRDFVEYLRGLLNFFAVKRLFFMRLIYFSETAYSVW
jgi:hypothetical protein